MGTGLFWEAEVGIYVPTSKLGFIHAQKTIKPKKAFSMQNNLKYELQNYLQGDEGNGQKILSKQLLAFACVDTSKYLE